MATYTTNYNLEKPEASDPFGDFRESYNDNLDIIDANLGGGGGGGDSVSWTQLQLSGTKIAEIDINGTSQNVYAPSGGGGGGDSVSWTQLQLSGTKIAEIEINGNTTNVYAPSGGGGGGSVIYSLSEQVVGTWIDNRPVYQKSFESSSALSSYQAIPHGISDFDDLVKAECILRNSDKSWQVSISTDQNNAELEITPTDIKIYLNNDFKVTATGGYFITLQYTKSTDT